MKFANFPTALGSACLFLFVQEITATAAHRHAHRDYAKRHGHGHRGQDVNETMAVEKRGTCTKPDDPSLYHVPGASNNGFAMSPDQPCTSGSYCPLACAPGKVMAQWQVGSTYVYPQSMNGGIYCNNGKVEKPFPDAPYCVDGTGTVSGTNSCGKTVTFCQTVLPGNEAMLIPTEVTSSAVLAVPGPSYWDSTAAHYYINPPGVDAVKGCVWGEESTPVGNWAPYVAGMNTDKKGDTYVKIAYNPIWTGSSLSNTPPTYGVEILCPGGGCNGMPCSINPATDGVGIVLSPVATIGVGGASFCVVTVPSGGSAEIHVFNTDGSSGSAVSSIKASSSPASSTSQPPTTSLMSTSIAPSSTLSSTSSTSTSTSSSTPTSLWTTSALPTSRFTTSFSTLSSLAPTSSSSSSAPLLQLVLPGIFHQNMTAISNTSVTGTMSNTVTPTSTAQPTAATGVAAAASTSAKSEGAADHDSSAVVGLIVAFVAAAALY